MIIRDILDNDLYSFTVMYFYMCKFPRATGEYTFIDRANTVYPKGFAEKLRTEIDDMKRLTVDPNAKSFLQKQLYFLPPYFIDFLYGYKFDPSEVTVSQDTEGHLSVSVSGPLYRIVLWEVPLLAMISELFYKESGITADMDKTYSVICGKAKTFNQLDLKVSEFGTRRRFSFDVQDRVIQAMSSYMRPETFPGTSNVYLAYKYNLKAIGTMSHQVISLVASVYGPKEANYFAMQMWQDVFDGNLGVFLTDTFTLDVFLDNFGTKFAKLFDGTRHDSGCPFTYVNKIVEKYKKLNIDPKSKTITFSNSLDLESAFEIRKYCYDKINPQFGIGTYLTNDVVDTNGEQVKPRNIVIKLTSASITEMRTPSYCIKLSDDKGKHCGDEATVELYKKTLNII